MIQGTELILFPTENRRERSTSRERALAQGRMSPNNSQPGYQQHWTDRYTETT